MAAPSVQSSGNAGTKKMTRGTEHAPGEPALTVGTYERINIVGSLTWRIESYYHLLFVVRLGRALSDFGDEGAFGGLGTPAKAITGVPSLTLFLKPTRFPA
jgi:hypothetical protein